MEPFWISFLHIFFLCAAVCIDTFAAAFGFGIDQIRIPALSALVLSLVSSAALSLSMLAAGWLTPYLPAGLTGWLSCALLCGLGLLKLFDSAIKRLVRRLPQPGRELSFSFLRMRFLLRVWADPATADTNCSSVLSAAESVALALALSSDGLAAGLGGGFSGLSPWAVFFCSAGMNLICILTGSLAGRKAAGRACFDLSWLGGVILFGMGLLALV